MLTLTVPVSPYRRLQLGLYPHEKVPRGIHCINSINSTVHQRIKYKTLLLPFKRLRGEGPRYLTDLLIVTSPVYMTRHQTGLKVFIPKTVLVRHHRQKCF